MPAPRQPRERARRRALDEIEITRSGGEAAAAVGALCAIAMPDPWSPSAIQSELELDGASLWLAWAGDDGSALAGVLLARRILDVVSIQLVAVAPDRRRQRIASALLQRLQAAERDAARMELEVRAGNDAAIALYTARGFEVVGRRPRYYRGVEDAILMTRPPRAPG